MIGSGLKVVVIESGNLTECDRNQALYAGSSTGRPVDLEVGRYRVFGGSTSRWAGRCATLDPIDLERRDWIEWSGWPITADDLNKFYSPASNICGLSETMRMVPRSAEAADRSKSGQFSNLEFAGPVPMAVPGSRRPERVAFRHHAWSRASFQYRHHGIPECQHAGHRYRPGDIAG